MIHRNALYIHATTCKSNKMLSNLYSGFNNCITHIFLNDKLQNHYLKGMRYYIDNIQKIFA